MDVQMIIDHPLIHGIKRFKLGLRKYSDLYEVVQSCLILADIRSLPPFLCTDSSG